MSPLAYLCPACGTLTDSRGRCATCKRADARHRYHAEPTRQVRSTARYRRQRDAAKARDGHRCQTCGATENLEAHHLTPLEQGGDPFALDNLVTLCASCHRRQPDFFSTGSNTRTPAVSQSVRVPHAGGG